MLQINLFKRNRFFGFCTLFTMLFFVSCKQRTAEQNPQSAATYNQNYTYGAGTQTQNIALQAQIQSLQNQINIQNNPAAENFSQNSLNQFTQSYQNNGFNQIPMNQSNPTGNTGLLGNLFGGQQGQGFLGGLFNQNGSNNGGILQNLFNKNNSTNSFQNANNPSLRYRKTLGNCTVDVQGTNLIDFCQKLRLGPTQCVHSAERTSIAHNMSLIASSNQYRCPL